MTLKNCFLIEDPLDLFYLTHLELSTGMLLVAETQEKLFVDARYIEAAQRQKKIAVSYRSDALLQAFLKEARVKQLIFDSAKTSCERLKQLRSLVRPLKISLKGKPQLLKEARLIKTPEEIEKLKKSAELNFAGYQFLLTLLKEGITEKELAVAFHIFCLERGADELSFEPIIAFGKNSALPHYRAGNAKLKSGDCILFDLGVQLNSYASDMTRMHFFGKVDPELKKLYAIVLKAHKAALSLCKPGTKVGDIDTAARAEMAKEDVESLFVHSLGHGVGLEVHEYPRVRQKAEDHHLLLRPGMVLAIEPGLYIQGRGGVRYEDTLVITQDGYLNLYPDEAT